MLKTTHRDISRFRGAFLAEGDDGRVLHRVGVGARAVDGQAGPAQVAGDPEPLAVVELGAQDSEVDVRVLQRQPLQAAHVLHRPGAGGLDLGQGQGVGVAADHGPVQRDRLRREGGTGLRQACPSTVPSRPQCPFCWDSPRPYPQVAVFSTGPGTELGQPAP